MPDSSIGEAMKLLNEANGAADYGYRQKLFRSALRILEQHKKRTEMETIVVSKKMFQTELEDLKKRSVEILNIAREDGTGFREVQSLFREMFNDVITKFNAANVVAMPSVENLLMFKAIEHYGVKNQIAVAMGEMGELAASLTQYFFQNRGVKNDVAGEIADVLIMLRQITLHLGINSEVEGWREEKLERLKQRIEAK